MKIIAVSDTHGSLVAMDQVLSKHRNADIVVHCGDSQTGIENIKLSHPHHTYVSVCGNCDFYTMYKDIEEFTAEGVRFFVTHGHRFGVKFGLKELRDAARERGAGVVIFGHTHVAMNEYRDGIWFVNPGACRGSHAPFAVIEVKNGEILTNLAHL